MIKVICELAERLLVDPEIDDKIEEYFANQETISPKIVQAVTDDYWELMVD